MGKRDRLRRLYSEYEAIFILLQGMDREARKTFDAFYSTIDKVSRDKVNEEIYKIKTVLKRLKIEYGIKANQKYFLEFLEFAKNAPAQEPWVLLPKWVIKSKVANYDKVIPKWDLIPEHARIGIDPTGNIMVEDKLEIFLLETMLYEDMAALYNLANSKYPGDKRHLLPKLEIKSFNALLRATIVSAFNFVEAYLNGIAYDFYMKNENSISDEVAGVLLERDESNSRDKYVSIRFKCLHYPKIILGVNHPPLQESNCNELEIFLNKLKLMRDSVVHPTAKPDMQTWEPYKEQTFYNITFDSCTEVVDACIQLVRKIHNTINGSVESVQWLRDRDLESGIFDDSVFI